MKITITGASGFVGQNLSTYLEENNFSVKRLSLRQPEWKKEISKNADALIHLAGKAHDTSQTSDAESYFEINRDLTIAVFRAFLDTKIKDFFFFSSVKAAADSVEGQLTESVVKNPETPYGKSKAEAEDFLLSQNLPEGKRLFIIRPCMIHGEGNKGNLNLLFSLVNKGFPWPLAAFDNKRSFLSMDNLCYLIKEMIENSEVPAGIYNFADDETVSTNELIRIIAETTNRKPKLWRIPKVVIKTMASLGGIIRLPLNPERLKKLTEDYEVSNRKIKRALDKKHLPLTAKQGLVKTIKSFDI